MAHIFEKYMRPLMFGFSKKNVRAAVQHGGPVYASKYRTSMDPTEHKEHKPYVYGNPGAQRTMSWRKAAGSKHNKKHRFVGTHAGHQR